MGAQVQGYYLIKGVCQCRTWPIVYRGQEYNEWAGTCEFCTFPIVLREAMRNEDGSLVETFPEVVGAMGDWDEWHDNL